MPRQAGLQELGASIRATRLRQGLTQSQLADRADIHRAYLSGVERGSRNLTWESLMGVADALDVHISDLAIDAESLSVEPRRLHA